MFKLFDRRDGDIASFKPPGRPRAAHAAVLQVVGALCLASVCQTAAAQTYREHGIAAPRSVDNVRQTRVSYSDLNLDEPQDALVMLRRIRQAATLVCNGDATANNADAITAYEACFHRSLSRAVIDLGAAQVTVAFGARRPGWILPP